jgi:hypothetical protein
LADYGLAHVHAHAVTIGAVANILGGLAPGTLV